MSLMRQPFLPLIAALLLGSAGCELISSVDRSKIPGAGGAATGGSGGMTTGGSGGTSTGGTGGTNTGGTNTGGTNTGGMNTGGTGPVCGAGVMTCTVAADCPDPGTECVQRTCDMGCCGTTNVADLTPTTGGQTDKDCQQVVCDGAGMPKLVDDDADVPDASDECHTASCAAGQGVQTPTAAGSPCPLAGNVCDGNGTCVGCLIDGDCASPKVCDPVNGSHTCVDPGCTDGSPNGNETDKDCGGPDCGPCATGLMCLVGTDCVSGVCDGVTNTCAAPTCNDGVKNGNETGVDCGGATCGGGMGLLCAFGEGCTGPTDCDTGACNGSTCTYKPQGTGCNNHGECGAAGSNLCVDGVCCDTSCTNGCQACSAAKKGGGGDGVCGNVATGTDPNNLCTDGTAASCGDTGVCDGAGACQKYAAGTVCRVSAGNCDVTETCPGAGAACPTDGFQPATTSCGSTCTGGTETLSACNATGMCVAGSPTTCTNGCNAGGTLCATPCTLDTDCLAGNYCNAGSCDVKVVAGGACSGNNQCVSGTCGTAGSGNCCATACTTGGTCGATSCDATGACVGPSSATSCGSTCAGNTLTPSACSGTGTCVMGTPSACPGGLNCADATTCLATCTVDTDCTSSSDFCNGGTCSPKVADGGSCGTNGECVSGMCGTTGTGNCCSTTCNTTDPTCGATDCNGTGACSYPTSATPCGTSSCTGSTITTSTCDGSGTCAMGTPTACAGGLICGSATACLTTCTVDTDCASAGDFCNGGTCSPKVANGGACGGNNQCTSAMCGTTGTGNCCAAACSTAGVCGAMGCDGTGACAYPTTPCGSTCTGSTIMPSACDGAGSCMMGAPSACPGGLICADATTCLATCTVDTDCASAGDFCNGGTCSPKVADGGSCGGNNECTSAMCGTTGTGNCCTAACDTSDVTCGATDCDGTGACSYPTMATPCGASACSGNMITASACDGSGTCAMGTPTACAGGLNCADATTCLATCTLDTDCASATDFCNGGTCSPKVADGGACFGNNECVSTICGAAGTGNCCTMACATSCDATGACVAPPGVMSVTPDAPSTPAANTTIAVTFTTAMSAASLTTQTTAGACTGSLQVSKDDFATCIALAAPTFSGGGTIATLRPTPGLLINRSYKVRVTTAAQSSALVALGAQYTSTGFTTTNPLTAATGVVISQVYGGGGNSGAIYKNDFIELHNRGTAAVDVGGWAVQYVASGGSGTWAVTAIPAATMIQPGGFLLVQEAAGSGGTTDLPTPDVIGTIGMGGTGGKVALTNNTTALSGACPSGAALVDFVGYSANCSEGSATGTTSTSANNTTSASRNVNGCTDTDVNNADFTNGAVNPRNSASAAFTCAPAQNESGDALEADFCTTQFPLSLSVATGSMNTVYGRIYEAGVTDQMVNPPAGVTAQLGYGPTTANPEYEYGWTWANASHNAGCDDTVGQCGAEDEFQATFTAPAVGTYNYAYRFSLDGGASWTYCDNRQGDNGAGSNASLDFNLTDVASMTVTP